MPGYLSCDTRNRGAGMLLHEAAIRLSRGEQLSCGRCGCPVRYYVRQKWANARKRGDVTFEVKKVARLYPHARKDRFDPFLLWTQNVSDRTDVKILPIFWAPGKTRKISGGQFPPFLSPQDWKKLFQKLGNRAPT